MNNARWNIYSSGKSAALDKELLERYQLEIDTAIEALTC